MLIFQADIALIRVSHEICDNQHLYISNLRGEVHHSCLLPLTLVCYRSTHRAVYVFLEWSVQATCSPLPNC